MDKPLSKHFDIEPQMPGKKIDLFLVRRQQVQQEGGQPAIVKLTRYEAVS
jgi:hypothetical protein